MVIAVLLAITVVFATHAMRVPIDSSLEALVVEDDPDRAFFDAFQERFGADEFLVAAVENYRLFTSDALEGLSGLTKRLETIPGVTDVTSLANVEDIIGDQEDFVVEPFLQEIPKDDAALRELRIRAASNPNYVGGLVSSDAKTGAIVIEIDDKLTGRQHSTTVESILAVLHGYTRSKIYVAGKPLIDHLGAQYMKQDLRRFIPLTVVLMGGILWLLLRNIFGTLLPLVAMGLCLVWAVGFLGTMNSTMNNITTILPPLMMSLTVAVTIHLMTTYQNNLLSARFRPANAAPSHGGGAEHSADSSNDVMGMWVERLQDRKVGAAERSASDDITAWSDNLRGAGVLQDTRLAVQQTLIQLWRPCLVASLTTAASFISLTVSDVPPMRDFGVAAAVGVLFSLVIAFTLLPAAWVLVRRPIAKPRDLLRTDWTDNLLLHISALVEAQPRRVLLLTVLLSVIAVIGLARLRVETNFLEYFHPGSEIVRDTDYVEKHLSGVEDVRVSLQSDDMDSILSLQNLLRLESLHAFLLARPEVDKVSSVLDYLKEMNQAFHNEDRRYYCLPDSQDLIAQYMLLYSGEDIRKVLDEDQQGAAVYVRVHEHSSRKVRRLIRDLQQFLHSEFPGNIETRVTGPTVLTSNLIDTLVRSQISSLALASAVVFCMVAALFWSLQIGLLAMLPNLLPILLNLGLMGWAGISLDTATAMISAVAIGIAVDDTVHFIAEYKDALIESASVQYAVRRALVNKGRAMVFTSAILALAFGILIVSNFLPTAHFGLLSALTMLFALVADLFFLPALLLVARPRL